MNTRIERPIHPFYLWLRKLSWKWKSLIGGGITVSILQTFFKNIPIPASAARFDAVLATVQCVVVLGLFFATLIVKPRIDDRQYDEASEAVRQFRIGWVFLWGAWAIFWFFWAAHRWIESESMQHPEAFFSILFDAANFLNTLGLVACFRVLSRRTTGDATHSFALVWITGGTLIAIVLIAEGFAMFMPPASQIAIAGAKWAVALSGGCALCLFVGRLESKIIDTPTLVVMSLYLYAITQGGYPLFGEQTSTLELVFTNLFLICKCILFLYVTWLISGGDLLYYMKSVREVIDSSAKKRKQFLATLE